MITPDGFNGDSERYFWRGLQISTNQKQEDKSSFLLLIGQNLGSFPKIPFSIEIMIICITITILDAILLYRKSKVKLTK